MEKLYLKKYPCEQIELSTSFKYKLNVSKKLHKRELWMGTLGQCFPAHINWLEIGFLYGSIAFPDGEIEIIRI